ncbi:MAG TPA: tRNA 2-thiouridine(34) synthase MnmA [Saprospiraceae bacterium]|nr:tRNA 2-thiouridine(34) synthase MnmA [Saprospirales bacterium]HRQ30829.1 tRNA 2-thiouridine(34) synthase MnmA [Saprospiraceae bacterium]
MSKHGKILVGMSGGVDSTVTALLLHEQGYEVIGVTLNILDYTYAESRVHNPCCSLDSVMGAKEIADFIGFKHMIVDIREKFSETVMEGFKEEYMRGRTPNPCIWCNAEIKWKGLIQTADEFGCEKIATGHYARTDVKNGRTFLKRGVDPLKDQSYFLWALDQHDLSRTVFPLGEMTKPEVRSIAFTRGHVRMANKQENFDICFVPDNDYRAYLKDVIPGMEEDYKGGNFVDKNGNVLGQHEGYMHYTIGQRKGLGIALGIPMYVTRINASKNTVELGEETDLIRNGMIVGRLNPMKYDQIPEMEAVTMIRYKSKGVLSQLKRQGEQLSVEFLANTKGVAPGQSAVFYEDDDVIGGGIIMESL